MAVPCQSEPNVNCGFPYFPNEVYYTEEGVPYFKECGVAMIGKTQSNLNTAFAFLNSFGESSQFTKYLDDIPDVGDLDPGALLCKFAGQTCYLSFGPNRTFNKDSGRYFKNIRDQKHFSVLEHSSYSFLFWGIDRATTHELVRHRHFSPSQTSQRFCNGETLRFVERPEYQPERLHAGASDELRVIVEGLHESFELGIESTVRDYDNIAERLIEAADAGHLFLKGKTRTELRKHMNQTARELLENATEAPIIFTGNTRSWREFVDKRATAAADVPIRELAVKTLRCLQYVSPLLFGDYEITTLDDGTEVASC